MCRPSFFGGMVSIPPSQLGGKQWCLLFVTILPRHPQSALKGSQLPLKREPAEVGAAGKGLLFSVLAAAGIPPAATPPPPFGKGGLQRWVLPGGGCLPAAHCSRPTADPNRTGPATQPGGDRRPPTGGRKGDHRRGRALKQAAVAGKGPCHVSRGTADQPLARTPRLWESGGALRNPRPPQTGRTCGYGW